MLIVFFVFIVYDVLDDDDDDDDLAIINLSNDVRDQRVAEYEAITGLQASAEILINVILLKR
ncbi:hypothetical protein [Shewanella sp. S1-49-MNA-CIBAN-0167]|uniref:hypothetical protein n=1 Tax=Shewanella sp. S1-49-MNA-CIBAN-0167 TaxID=3140468 RepID=UPI00332CC260